MTRQEAELIFTKISRSNPINYNSTPTFRPENYLTPSKRDIKKIDFNHFLKALEEIALKLMPRVEISEALTILI